MHEDHLIVCLQTQFQLDAFRRLGSQFIGIDATHNTCHDPSHGGFYMAEGALYIRIGLLPHVGFRGLPRFVSD